MTVGRSTCGLILQNTPHDPPGLLGDWLRERAISHRVHRAWDEHLPADPPDAAFVVTLGSERSAAAEDPRTVEQLTFLRQAIDAGVPVFGICYGAQMLARALGGSVAPAPAPEIGWKAVQTDDRTLVPAGPWAEFHFDAFALPAGAREVARNRSGSQAFVAGPHLGTQFHPEVTPDVVDGWARRAAGRRPDLGLDLGALAETGRRWGPQAARQARVLFQAWFARCAPGAGRAATAGSASESTSAVMRGCGTRGRLSERRT